MDNKNRHRESKSEVELLGYIPERNNPAIWRAHCLNHPQMNRTVLQGQCFVSPDTLSFIYCQFCFCWFFPLFQEKQEQGGCLKGWYSH